LKKDPLPILKNGIKEAELKKIKLYLTLYEKSNILKVILRTS